MEFQECRKTIPNFKCDSSSTNHKDMGVHFWWCLDESKQCVWRMRRTIRWLLHRLWFHEIRYGRMGLEISTRKIGQCFVVYDRNDTCPCLYERHRIISLLQNWSSYQKAMTTSFMFFSQYPLISKMWEDHYVWNLFRIWKHDMYRANNFENVLFDKL